MYLCISTTVALLTCQVPCSSLFSYSLCPSACGWPGARLEIPSSDDKLFLCLCERVCEAAGRAGGAGLCECVRASTGVLGPT